MDSLTNGASLYFLSQRGLWTSRLFKQSLCRADRNATHVSPARSCTCSWTVAGEATSGCLCGSAQSPDLNGSFVLEVQWNGAPLVHPPRPGPFSPTERTRTLLLVSHQSGGPSLTKNRDSALLSARRTTGAHRVSSLVSATRHQHGPLSKGFSSPRT